MTVNIQAMNAEPTESLSRAYSANTTNTSCSSAMIADDAKRISLNRNQMYSSIKNAATNTATTACLRISPEIIELIFSEEISASFESKFSSNALFNASRSSNSRVRVLMITWFPPLTF